MSTHVVVVMYATGVDTYHICFGAIVAHVHTLVLVHESCLCAQMVSRCSRYSCTCNVWGIRPQKMHPLPNEGKTWDCGVWTKRDATLTLSLYPTPFILSVHHAPHPLSDAAVPFFLSLLPHIPWPFSVPHRSPRLSIALAEKSLQIQLSR